MSDAQGRHGYTLIELMIALGILAVAYVALLEAQSGSIRLSTYGKQISIATFLAQAKIEEIEETLHKEGFPDMDDTDEGNFEDLGYPSFKWRLEINKVELPLGEALSQLLAFGGEQGEESGAGGLMGKLGALGDVSELESMLGGQIPDNLKSQLGGMLGGAGGASALSSMINPEMLRGNVEMLSGMIEQALREVHLTVFWDEGGPGSELVLTTHLVQVPEASGAAGAGMAPAIAGKGDLTRPQPGQPTGTSGTTGIGSMSRFKTQGGGKPIAPGTGAIRTGAGMRPRFGGK
ncbi:MAG: type II secretion system protein [Deltaproteobacteria bacterium]|nr:type II secretion system protein [Deltaproteobacteria bacterium]